MRRREWLASALGGLGALTGCLGAPTAGVDPGPAEGRDRRRAMGEVSLPVARDALTRGAARDAIPAITEPAFGSDWSGIELEVRNELDGERVTIRPRLDPEEPVIGVEQAGDARAYPLRVLNWFEVVNDRLGGPLLVTYCPLCASGVVAERAVDGTPTVFDVSGLLWRSNLVMVDRATGSYWSQLLARAIRGPATGTRLRQRPASRTTLGAWRERHPGTAVLLPPPLSGTTTGREVRNYTIDPYAGYLGTDSVGLGNNAFADTRLPPKAHVVGVAVNGTATAYPLSAVAAAGVINDTVGGRPVVIAAGREGRPLAAYDRRLDGRVLRFSTGRARDGTMWGGGSRWRVGTGRAVDGVHAGRRLTPASDVGPVFWFSWLDLHPETALYTG